MSDLPAVLASTPTLQQVQQLENELRGFDQIACPVEHYFAPGLYTRKCSIPANSVVVGKMHRHQHPTFLMSGTVRINTDRGMETITGPHIWISQENAKRALYTMTDCVFATVHLNPSDTTDLDAIEAEVIVSEPLITHESKPALGEYAETLQEVYA